MVLAGGNGIGIRFSNRELDPLWGAGARFALARVLLVIVMVALRLAVPRGRALAGAVAFGLAENGMDWSAGSPQSRDYLTLLTGSGWTPDDWTAAVLDRNAARDAFATELTATDDPDTARDDDEHRGGRGQAGEPVPDAAHRAVAGEIDPGLALDAPVETPEHEPGEDAGQGERRVPDPPRTEPGAAELTTAIEKVMPD